MTKSKLWIIPILFLIAICFTSAYDTSKLVSYYSFEDISTSKVLDLKGNHNLINDYNNTWTSLTGIRDNGFNIPNNIYYIFHQNNSLNLDNLTINFWLKTHRSISGGDTIRLRSSDNYDYKFKQSTSAVTSIVCFKTNFTVIGSTAKNNVWKMITLTISGIYNSSDKQYSLFEDGIYLGTGIADIFDIINMTLFNFETADVVDELSLWNYQLDNYDIGVTLYNSGNGLNYTETINAVPENYSIGCIDEYTYCTNRGYNGEGYQYIYYCNSQAESQFCSGGCINDLCYQTTPAECGTVGESKCIDTTNYAVCSDSNYDGYLDFGEIHSCNLGTYCVDYFHLADCLNITQNGTHDKYGLIVTPYAISNENTSYIVNGNTKTVDVQSVFSLHEQQFYTQGTTYISRTCNYAETSLYSYGQQSLNTSTDFDMYSATNQNTIIRLSINPNFYANGSINIISQASSSMGTLKYIRNATAKRLCIYDNSDNEIYCDYDYTGTDTLKSLDLEYTYDFASRTYTVKMTFMRTYSQTKIIYPQTFVGNDIFRINIDSNDTILNSIIVVNIPIFSQYGTTQYNTLTILPCLYSSIGLTRVRTYGNNNGMPDYSVYTDYDVNIINLGLTQEQLSTATGYDFSGKGLSQGVKYLIVLATIMTIMIGFTAIGFSIQMIQASFIVGSIMSTFVLIIFTVFGWISWIVIVMLLIVAIAVSILISKTNTNNMQQG